MYKYCFRIIHNDFKNWVPLIWVVFFLSFLVGSCIYQMVWTYSDTFIESVQSQGFNQEEFHIVSQTIYLVVFTLAFFSLTVVGNTTVRRSQDTFAQWKLIGASNNDVRNCLLGMIIYIGLLGAFPGALISFLSSYYTVPIFNRMAAQGFGSETVIRLPDYHSSYIGFILTLIISIATCCAGTVSPIYKSGTIQPVDVIKKIYIAPHSRIRNVFSTLSIVFISFLLIIFILYSAALDEISIETLFNASLQSGILATFGVYFSIPLLILPAMAKVSKVFLKSNRYKLGVAFSSTMDKFFMNHYSLTCLFIGISCIGIISTVIDYSENVLEKFGIFEISLIDTLVLTTLFASTCLVVSIAISQLNTGLVKDDQKLLKIAGYTSSELVNWHLINSLIHASSVTLLAFPPVVFTSIIASTMYHTITGHTYIYFPAVQLILSFIICWVLFFTLNILNNIATLNKSVGKELR